MSRDPKMAVKPRQFILYASRVFPSPFIMPISESDVEKLFLQAVLSRGIVSTKLAKILWKKSREAVKGSCSSVVVELAVPNLFSACNQTVNLPAIRPEHEDTAFVDFAQRISTSLDKLDLEFRCGRDETSGVEMWAIVRD